MAELDSWAIGATADRKVGTEDARRAISALLWPGSTPVGILAPQIRMSAGSPLKVTATGTPGANVTVNAGQCFPDLGARPGAYIATLDATKTVAILDVPADPSNQRNDLIVAQQRDADYGDADRAFEVKRVQGTASGSPADPSVTGGANYIVLARVRVTAGATTITNAMIDDLRPAKIVALGGVKPVLDATERATLPLIEGLVIYRTDRDWIEICDGTVWRVQGVAVVSSGADLSAITNPYNGLMAFNTGANAMLQYRSGAWHLAAPISYDQPAQTGSGSLGATATATIATVSIPDLGVPYKIEAWGQLATTTPATGNPADIQANYDSTVWDTNRIGLTCDGIGPVVGIDTICVMMPRQSASVSGAKTVRLLCKAGANAITVGTGNYNFGVRAMPAVP